MFSRLYDELDRLDYLPPGGKVFVKEPLGGEGGSAGAEGEAVGGRRHVLQRQQGGGAAVAPSQEWQRRGATE